MALYDLNHEVSQAAAEALTRFDPPALGVLEETLHHPESAVIGLGKIRDVRVTPLLSQMLNDPGREARKRVLRAMGELKDRVPCPPCRRSW
jgi:HEAT repeat protein